MAATAEELLNQVLPANPPLAAAVSRELSLEDLILLETTPLGSKPPAIQKIRAIHHAAARLLAVGTKSRDVAIATGLCESRISILQCDPAFAELVSFYSAREDQRFEDVQERARILGLSALEELQERLEESPKEIPSKILVSIMTASLDRGGHAPKTRHEHLHAFLSKEDLQALKNEVPRGSIIRRPYNSGASISGDDSSPTGAELPPPAERVEGEGSSV